MAVAWSLKEFILTCLKEDQRIDGRRPFDCRRLGIRFAREDGGAEVQLGQTHIICVVSGELVQPYRDRPNEGILLVYIEFSPMADPTFEAGRQGEIAAELGRMIDRGLRESRAVDMESLCVLSGKAVWSLRLDISILDNGGNLVDAANIASLAALLSYRRPDCSIGGVDGDEISIHSPEMREPLPLTIHYLPIAVTFAFFGDGEFVVVDPGYKEELVMKGRMTVIMNIHGDICTIQKAGGVGVRVEEIRRCLRIASTKIADITTALKKAAESHETERARRKRKWRVHARVSENLAATSNLDTEKEMKARDALSNEAPIIGKTSNDEGSTSSDQSMDSDDEEVALKPEKASNFLSAHLADSLLLDHGDKSNRLGSSIQQSFLEDVVAVDAKQANYNYTSSVCEKMERVDIGSTGKVEKDRGINKKPVTLLDAVKKENLRSRLRNASKQQP